MENFTPTMKKFPLIWVIITILLLETNLQILEDSGDMKIVDFVTKHGYQIETHVVETEDGYLLTVYRISRGQNDFSDTPNKHPLLLNHALLTSAEIWVVLGPKKSLGFVLADNGYDVWLLNCRGTWHSNRHKTLKPSQKKFWDFSWHEMGVYDIPATIDYILKMTSKTSLHYAGHSQGSTSFFVMGSERPEYLNKIKVAVTLAPGARYKYIKNPILKMISPYYRLIEALTDKLKIWMLPPPFLSANRIRRLAKSLCFGEDRLNFICKFVAGIYSPRMNLVDLSSVLSIAPSTCSAKQPLHYAQLITTGNFQKYDFGPEKNAEKYGTELPPLYNVKNITCPVALFWGPADDLVSEEDVQYLLENVPNIVENYRVPRESFSHVDFVLGDNLDELMYKQILKVMEKFK